MNETSTASNIRSIFYSTGIIWYILGVVETVLVFRFALKIIAASTDAWFTNAVYAISYPLTLPFTAVFGVQNIKTATVEWTTLLAILAYWVLAVGITEFILMEKPVTLKESRINLMKHYIL